MIWKISNCNIYLLFTQMYLMFSCYFVLYVRHTPRQIILLPCSIWSPFDLWDCCPIGLWEWGNRVCICYCVYVCTQHMYHTAYSIIGPWLLYYLYQTSSQHTHQFRSSRAKSFSLPCIRIPPSLLFDMYRYRCKCAGFMCWPRN